jgi:hypothetical protein
MFFHRMRTARNCHTAIKAYIRVRFVRRSCAVAREGAMVGKPKWSRLGVDVVIALPAAGSRIAVVVLLGSTLRIRAVNISPRSLLTFEQSMNIALS